MAVYDEARLCELVDHVAVAVDRFRAGVLDAFAVDEVIHRYDLAARELWKFCLLGGGVGVEFAARAVRDMDDQDEHTGWRALGAPREWRTSRARSPVERRFITARRDRLGHGAAPPYVAPRVARDR